MEKYRSRTDSGQQIVRILGSQHQNQMLGRFFQRLQQRVRRLLIGTVDMVDQENAAASVQRLELRALLQQTHLLNGDLPQRTIWSKSKEIRMRGEQQRLIVPFVGGPFLALGDNL